jgi:hypothetical protein
VSDSIVPVVFPDPWTGTSYTPAAPLDIATLEAAIVSQLQNYLAATLGPQIIEVTHFPDRPEAYEIRHRIGVAMVIYTGGDYGKILDIGYVAQERTLEFSVRLRIRDLGWAFGGPPSGTSPGAYQVLEAIRRALLGYQVNSGCTPMKAIRERFIDRDKQGGVWVYELVFATRTVVVDNYQSPNAPLFLKGTVQEEAGVTAVQVGVALMTFSPAGRITLPQGNLSGVTVMSSDLSLSYLNGADYSVDIVNGIITWIPGSIPANATVAISYAYSDVVTALATGGSVPFSPNN